MPSLSIIGACILLGFPLGMGQWVFIRGATMYRVLAYWSSLLQTNLVAAMAYGQLIGIYLLSFAKSWSFWIVGLLYLASLALGWASLEIAFRLARAGRIGPPESEYMPRASASPPF